MSNFKTQGGLAPPWPPSGAHGINLHTLCSTTSNNRAPVWKMWRTQTLLQITSKHCTEVLTSPEAAATWNEPQHSRSLCTASCPTAVCPLFWRTDQNFSFSSCKVGWDSRWGAKSKNLSISRESNHGWFGKAGTGVVPDVNSEHVAYRGRVKQRYTQSSGLQDISTISSYFG